MSVTAVETARTLLSTEERSRCDRYRLERDRRDYTAAHALLRLTLSRYCAVEPQSWRFEIGMQGKPELAMPHSVGRLSFNLSHSRGIVACAVTTDAAVGIDVERTDLAFDCAPIASRYFSTDEIAQLNRCAPIDRSAMFVELWTLKEAYLKATGQGLWKGLRGPGFSVEGERVCFLPAGNVDREAWQFAVFAVEPHARISVAANCRVAPEWTLTRLDPQMPTRAAVERRGQESSECRRL